MKDIKEKNCKKPPKSPEEIRVALAQTRPTEAELRQAIEKSLKKNYDTLKILAKR